VLFRDMLVTTLDLEALGSLRRVRPVRRRHPTRLRPQWSATRRPGRRWCIRVLRSSADTLVRVAGMWGGSASVCVQRVHMMVDA
jgi:hypothetical protein